MGDEETIKSTLHLLQTNRPTRRGSPANALSGAANPDVIPRLIGNLMIDESPEYAFDEACQFITPLSMTSTHIIQPTIVESPAFSHEVKEWCRPLSRVDFGVQREGIRAWWVLNKDALMRKNYQAAIPVKPEIKTEVELPE